MACWNPGDFLLVFYGQGANAIPTLSPSLTPSVGGGNQSAGPLGHRSGYRFLLAGDTSLAGFGSTGGAETNGAFVILRGVHATTPIGRASGTGASGSNANYPALTAPLLGGSTSRVFLGVHTTGSAASITTPPGASSLLTSTTVETVRRAIFLTAAVSSWSSTTQSVGSGGAYQTTVQEIRADAGGVITVIDQGVFLTQTLTLPSQCVVADRFQVAWL